MLHYIKQHTTTATSHPSRVLGPPGKYWGQPSIERELCCMQAGAEGNAGSSPAEPGSARQQQQQQVQALLLQAASSLTQQVTAMHSSLAAAAATSASNAPPQVPDADVAPCPPAGGHASMAPLPLQPPAADMAASSSGAASDPIQPIPADVAGRGLGGEAIAGATPTSGVQEDSQGGAAKQGMVDREVQATMCKCIDESSIAREADTVVSNAMQTDSTPDSQQRYKALEAQPADAHAAAATNDAVAVQYAAAEQLKALQTEVAQLQARLAGINATHGNICSLQ